MTLQAMLKSQYSLKHEKPMLLSAASKMNPGGGIIIDHLQNQFHGSVVFLMDAIFDATLVFNILNNL